MPDLINSKSKDEINLRDLFLTLWAYKLLIISTCALGIFFGAYYALYAKKVFTSEAIFNFDQGASSPEIGLSKSLSAIGSLSGLGLPAKKNNTLEKIMGRVFIEKLDKKLDLKADPYFNNYNPNSVDPIWKSLIKRSIGWKNVPIDTDEAIWQNILSVYSEQIVVKETEEGSIKIIVTHETPQRAADIANGIMDLTISNSKDSKKKEQNQMLSYLSNTLAKSLNDLEVSQSNLKEFALKNSALPLESFAAGSFKLDALREQLNRTSELYDAVSALSLMLKNRATNQNNYLTLRQKFPIIDQVEFRRILGQSEIISSWSWPKANSVDAVLNTLLERKSRLKSQINAAQINAERSGLAMETHARLKREAKISEATYTVLIEQVKAQNVAAGYQPDKTEVYEYASVSISPSAPKRTQVLALGAILGLFVGAVLSLLLALRRGVYFSKEALKTGTQARQTASIRRILPLRNKSLENINTILGKNSYPILRDLAVEIHKSDTAQVVLTSSRAKLTGNDMAQAIACYLQSDNMKVAIIDFSSKAKKPDINEKKHSLGLFSITESLGNVFLLRPNNDLATMEMLSEKDFTKNIRNLNKTIDLLFLCADNNDAISLLRALQGQKMFHITLARTKYTKSTDLSQMNSLLPIQGLLHE